MRLESIICIIIIIIVGSLFILPCAERINHDDIEEQRFGGVLMRPSENGPKEKEFRKDKHIAKTERKDKINHLSKPDKYKKIDSNLIPLLDNNYLPPGYNLEDYLSTMKNSDQYLPAGSPVPREELCAPADLLYLVISLQEGFSTVAIEPFAWLITNRSEKHRLVIAWVQVDQLSVLADLEAVQTVRPVMPPESR